MAAQRRQTIADFDLVRVDRDSTMDERMNFLKKYGVIDGTTAEDWKFFEVDSQVEGNGLMFGYAVCVSKGVFVLFEAFLSEGAAGSPEYKRHTDMRLWQLILDCWAEAAGDEHVNSLQHIAIGDIINDDVRKDIRIEINSQMSAGVIRNGLGNATVGPSSVTWRTNFFTRAAERVAAALTNKTVARVHLENEDGGEEWAAPSSWEVISDDGSENPGHFMSMLVDIEDVPGEDLPAEEEENDPWLF